MNPELYVAYLSGKILCAFPSILETKEYIRVTYSDVDPFDVTIQQRWVTATDPSKGYR